MNKRVLFIAPHRKDRSPSQRFRFEQYFQYLEEKGFDCHLSYLLSKEDDKSFYSSGSILPKAWILLKCIFIRVYDLFRAFKYDIVFVQREAHFLGTIIFERLFKTLGCKLVFDFDDAIWFFDVSEGNKKFSYLKNPQKIAGIIGISDLVFAGNRYLANYAEKHNSKVLIIPTTIDTDRYTQKEIKEKNSICIGWSGSLTTIVHFKYAISFLKKIKAKYGEKVYVKLIGYPGFIEDGLDIKTQAWEKESEVKDLMEIDIGIMPLPDDEWARGKCGLKGLQYMALGIPTVMSPVGVNSEIINDGYNGLLAKTEEQWVEKLSLLIEGLDIRRKLGANARKTVELKYSVSSNKERYFDAFNKLTS